jgi:hypothetical protein
MSFLKCAVCVSLFVCLLSAQETLTNDSILKLMKAGMSEDVILGMVNSEPGTYTVTADAVISLKQAGVSDKIINAMVSHAGAKGDVGVRAASTEGLLLLHDGTPLRLRLSSNLSSEDATTGQTITFELLDEVTVDGLIVIPRGAMATGTVTDA